MPYKKITVVIDTVAEDHVSVKNTSLVPVNMSLVEVRNGGELAGKAFYLNAGYDWHLGQDSSGSAVLVPTKR